MAIDPQAAERAVNTRKVRGRRRLRFDSLEAMLRDAERIASAERVEQLGNWSPAQVFRHLAVAMEMSIDGIDVKPPAVLRMIGPWMKGRVLRRGMPAGFQLPRTSRFLPGADDGRTAEALDALRAAVRRVRAEPHREPSPLLGPMSVEEWNQLYLRHAELHLSFLIPHGAPRGEDEPA